MITWLNKTLGDVLAYGYVAVFLLTLGEITARYLFNAPTQWTLEVALIIAGIHYLFSGPAASATESHIRITVLTDRLADRPARLLLQLSRLVAAIVCLTVAYAAWKQAAFSVDINEYSGTTFNSRMPMILKMTLFVVLILMALQAVSYLIAKRSDDT